MKLTAAEKEYIKMKKPTLWVAEERIKNEQGMEIDFHNHLFQYDIFNDFSPKLVTYKAAQIGFSTAITLKTLHLAKYRGMDIMYTLPTGNDVKDFVGGKVNRIIAQNPVLQEWTKDKDTVEQKIVGDNIIYYRGTWTSKTAMMVSSDLNCYDEVDASKQDVIEQYSTRLQHSKHGWEWYFSHPSVPNNGVAKHWEKSDQKHWFHKCSRCSKRFFMSFPECVDLVKMIYVCPHCKKELREEDRRVGEWVQKFPKREWSGYWINLLMCPWVPAKKIVEDYNDKTEEQFTNKVLGLPYIGSGNNIEEGDLYQNLTSEMFQPIDEKNDRVIIGSDSGIKKHYVVGNDKGLFYYGVTETWDDIRALMKRFKRAILVVDHLPDITGPRELREEFPGRVFLCHYAEDRKTMQLVRWGKDKEAGNVIADRNRMIQFLVDEFRKKRIKLQGNENDWHEYVEHWLSMYKLTENDDYGIPKSKWYCSASKHNADWAHATVYWRTGLDKFKTSKSTILQDKTGFAIISPEVQLDRTIKSNPLSKVQKFEF